MWCCWPLPRANDVADNSRALKQIDYLPYYVYVGDKLVLDDAKTRAELGGEATQSVASSATSMISSISGFFNW